jgi:hypothetical protein
VPAEAVPLRVKNVEGPGIVVVREDGRKQCRAIMSGRHFAENLLSENENLVP